MGRLTGTLLLLVALLPRIAVGGETARVLLPDGRTAIASSADYFVNLAAPNPLKRVLEAGSNGGLGNAPLNVQFADARTGLCTRDTILAVGPSHPANVCRPHAERLPYHATAPPPSLELIL